MHEKMEIIKINNGALNFIRVVLTEYMFFFKKVVLPMAVALIDMMCLD
jgi:hypothetical protein